MPIEKLKKDIGALKYPNLEKTLEELSIVYAVSIENENCLKVVLATNSNEVFTALAKDIRNIYKESFDNISVFRENTEQKQEVMYSGSKKGGKKALSIKKVIAIVSGKGGVGKSTISLNLAVSLAQEGFSVGLIDVDAHGSSCAKIPGLEQEKLSWNDAGKMLPLKKHGVKIISVGNVVFEADMPIILKSAGVERTLFQLLEAVEWGDLDLLLIDIPSGTSGMQFAVAEALPISVAVVVTTPQEVSVDGISHTMSMLREMDIKIAGVVENMSYFIAPDTGTKYEIFGTGGAEILADKYKVDILGKIPLRMDIREKSDKGQIPTAYENDEIKSYYKEITGNLLKHIL